MIKRVLLCLSLLAVVVSAVDKEPTDTLKIKGRLNAYIQNVDVQGESNTAREEGFTHVEELNIGLSGPLKDGDAGVEMRGRNTNDERIQKESAELLYLHSYFKNKIWSLEAGDVAASLNPYIFGGSLKGLKARYKSPKKEKTWNYMIIGGVKKASWKELFKDVQNEQPTAYSGAVEAKYIYARAKEITVNVAAYKDDLTTGSANSSISGKEGFGVGLNGKWRFNRYITLKGRCAITDATNDLRNNKPSKTQNAFYIKLLTKPILKSLKSNFIYERVDSDFISLGGSGAKDKEQIQNINSLKISKRLRANLSLKANRDNLNGALNATQYIYYEYLRFNYYPNFLKRGNINFKFSNKDIQGRDADNNRQIAGIDFNLRKKSGWRYGGGVEYNDYTDHNESASSQISTIYKVIIGYKQKLNKNRFYRATINTNYQDIYHNQDKISFKIDAGYTHDKQLSMDLSYIINDTNYENSNDTQNSVSQFRTSYKIDTTGAKIVRLLLEKRDIFVDNDKANSYSEYMGKLSFAMNF